MKANLQKSTSEVKYRAKMNIIRLKADMNLLIVLRLISLLSPTTAILVLDFCFYAYRYTPSI